MGTSKAYGGPKWPGVNSAVGAAADAGGLSKEKIATAVGKFARAYKAHLTSGTITPGAGSRSGAASQGSSRLSSSGLGRGGGAGGAARSRAASEGARLANFISTAGHSGFQAAVAQFGLDDLKDKPLDEFLEGLTGKLAGEGGILEDDVLDHAMEDTLNELAEQVDTVEEFDQMLSNDVGNLEKVLQMYYANVIFNSFHQKEYSTVREKLTSSAETQKFFSQARELIREIVKEELSSDRDLSQVDWSGSDGQEIADSINQEVMDILNP